MTGRHTIEVREDRYVYTLQGAFDTDSVDSLNRAIDEQEQARDYVLVDLCALERCSRSARRGLVEVHRKWSKSAQRVVYLAKEGRMRGLSLWIMHMTGDEYAKAVGSDQQAEDWLRDRTGRQEQAWLSLGAEPPAKPAVRTETLGVGQAIIARAMVWMNRFVVGEPLEWTAEIIRVHGLRGLKKWTDAVGKAIDHLTGKYGDLNAQTMFGLSSMWTGCRSCSRGHILAANIIYFEETDQLFPLYEGDVLTWLRTSDDAAMNDIRERMRGAEDLAELAQLVDRYFQFKTGTLPDDSPDRPVFVELDAVWTLINECSIMAPFKKDFRQPHMPKLYRKRAVIARYHKARGKTL